MRATDPDCAFRKIRSGKLIGRLLFREVSEWEFSTNADKLNAWCLLFLKRKTHFKRVVEKLFKNLISDDPKSATNALLVLMYASNNMVTNPKIKAATRQAFVKGGYSTRINASRILAVQARLGDSRAKVLLKKALTDPDPCVRDNAKILS